MESLDDKWPSKVVAS